MSRILQGSEQQLVAELASHPAWAVLRRVMKERMEKEAHTLAQQLLAGSPLDETRVAYLRGRYAGIKLWLDKPLLEAVKVEKQLREDVTTNA